MRRSHNNSNLAEAVKAAGIDPLSLASFLKTSIKAQKSKRQTSELREQIIQAEIVAVLLAA